MQYVPFYYRWGIQKEKEYFVENLSLMVGSGMDVIRALDVLKNDMRSPGMKMILEGMEEDVSRGVSLSNALESSGLLTDHYLSLIRIGEENGRLTENLDVISLQQKKDRQFRAKLRSAMMYPVFVLILSTILGIGIAWFILPRLSQVFDSLNADLPLMTQILISTGDFLKVHGAYAVPGTVFLLLLLVYLIFFWKKTKWIGQSMLFILPGVKDLIREVELARFGYLMGSMLDAGLPVVQALESVRDSATFYAYRRVYAALTEDIESGLSFRKSFDAHVSSKKYIPSPIQQMVVTGEQSASLKETLTHIGEIFEEKTETTTKNLVVILEPLLLVVIWVAVMGVALAVIMPIYSLIGGFNLGTNTSPPPQQQNEVVESDDFLSASLLSEPKAEEVPSVVEEESAEVPEYLQMVRVGSLGAAERMNVRSAADRGSQIVDKVFEGDEFVFVEEKDGWIRVLLTSGAEGWIAADFLERFEIPAPQLEATEDLVQQPLVRVRLNGAGSFLNLRSAPSIESEILERLPDSNQYRVLDRSEEWFRVGLSTGVEGWVSADYVELLPSS